MKAPTSIISEALRLLPGDTERQRIFLMGAEFALYGRYGALAQQPDNEGGQPYPLQQALDTWLRYKAEKNQRYRPMGLRSLKDKLLRISGGNPEYAMRIVEFSMSNNYAGLFPPKDNAYERQQHTVSKVADILNG